MSRQQVCVCSTCTIAKEILHIFFTKICLIFSTCVNEALLCKGVPLCENKNDLKACKRHLPKIEPIECSNGDDEEMCGYEHWHPNEFFSTCKPFGHPDYVMPFGQTVYTELMTDVTKFYCLNRADVNPFLTENDGSNGTEPDSKTWTQWINTPCEQDGYRKCLGSRPDICVDAFCKYFIKSLVSFQLWNFKINILHALRNRVLVVF